MIMIDLIYDYVVLVRYIQHVCMCTHTCSMCTVHTYMKSHTYYVCMYYMSQVLTAFLVKLIAYKTGYYVLQVTKVTVIVFLNIEHETIEPIFFRKKKKIKQSMKVGKVGYPYKNIFFLQKKENLIFVLLLVSFCLL